MQKNAAGRLVEGYYMATVLFVVLDLAAGVNVRLSFLEGAPGWKWAYYGFCFVCAVVMHRRPDLRLIIGAVEGLMTMVGLIFGMYLGYTMAAVSSGSGLVYVILNYMISGFFAYLSWTKGLQSLGAR